MKKFTFLLGFILIIPFFLKAQTIGYHENFELPSQNDSVTTTSTTPGIPDWGITTKLHHGAGLRADSCRVKNSATTYLTTTAFSTTGNFNVILEFAQICKIDFLDQATIEVSTNGTSWTQLTGSQYMGTGQFASNGNKFTSNSYGGIWVPSNAAAVPTNTWWKIEQFNVSSLIGNVPQAFIRFRLSDGGPVGGGTNYGWLIDNIKVTMAASELVPPVITILNPTLTGLIFSIGPFQQRAKITDASGIDTAKIFYSINGGPSLAVGMTKQLLDTFAVMIPTVSDSDVVCWHIEAWDDSPAHNTASNPATSTNCFTAYDGITFPYVDNFDNFNIWSANGPGQWELGTPNYGATNTAHSTPNSWDVNLNAVYDNNAECYLLSPVFNFNNAINARLSFWLNYGTESSWDGTRMEYTTDGTTWNVLGTVNDPKGINWFNGILTSSTLLPAWHGASNGWKQSKLRLSDLNNISPTVRFRYNFHSDGSGQVAGVSLDDFKIELPAPQEAAIVSILNPVSGCGLNNETVTIRITNTGINAINGNFTASYKRGTDAPVTETVPLILGVNDTTNFTFTTPVNLACSGQANQNFTIKAWVSLTGDPLHSDDTTTKTITSKYVPIPPVVTNTTIAYGNSTTITATCPDPVEWYAAQTGGAPIATTYSLTTLTLYGTTVFWVQTTAPNGCTSIRVPDTVFVGQAPPYDASILALTAPISGVDMTSTEPVIVEIKNYGTQPITNFNVAYKIGNGAVITNVIPGPLAPSATLLHQFTTPANLLVYQSYNFKAWVSVAGDLNQNNDTVAAVVVNSMKPYCISSATTTPNSDIGNLTLSNCNNGNGNPTLNNPAAQNMYTNYSQSVSPVALMRGQTYQVSLSPIFSTTTAQQVCAKIFVDWNYNGTFEEASETAWAGPSSTTPWTNITLDVPLWATLGFTRLRVVLQQTTLLNNVHACGTYLYGETEDYTAIIIPQIPNDAGVIAIVNPPTVYPQAYNMNPEFTVKNFGLNPITSVGVHYRFDNQPVQSLTYTTTILPANSANIQFPAITLPAGQHSICAWTTLQWDSIAVNDTACRGMYGIPVDTLNYCDNFDGPVKFQSTPSSGTDWILGAPTGAFPAGGAQSAPNVWATNLNTSGYTDNASSYLTTQLFDWSGAVNTRLTFKYTCSTEQSWDGTRLEYSKDGGLSWFTLGAINDPNSTNWYTNTINSSGKPAWAGAIGWKEAKYKLNAFIPGPNPTTQVQFMRFRFVFDSDGGGSAPTYKGMAIDNFCLNIPCHKDAMADSLISPHGEIGVTTQATVAFRIKNNGIDTLTQLPVRYQVNNEPVVTELWASTGLYPDLKTNYTFLTKYYPPVGTYTLKVWVDLPNDCDHTNDTLYSTQFGIPVYTVPFADNFDTAGYSVFYPAGSLWEHGVPTSNIINFANTLPLCWKTNLDGPYPQTIGSEYLYSPQFDFTQGLDSLKFYHWAHISNNDQAKVEYLKNNGTWGSLGQMGDPNATNWYNSNASGGCFNANAGVPGWHESTYDIKGVQDFAIPTQFRMKFSGLYPNTTFNGWAIDDFRLTTPKIQYDGGVTSIISPSGPTIYGTDLNVQVTIKNFGWDTLTSVPVKYQINGITVGAVVWNGQLEPDQTTTVTFPPMPSPLSSFILCAYTDIPFDTYFSNDTTCTAVPVSPPDFDVSIQAILAPIDTTIHNNDAYVKVRIKNLGIDPVSEIPLSYTVGGVIGATETWTGGPLASGQEVDYTFTTPYKYDYLGFYYLCVYTSLSNDGYRKNDTVCEKIEEKYTGIGELDENGIGLSQSIPNPANDKTQIVYYIPKPGMVGFKLVSALGQDMYVSEGKETIGQHKIDLNTSKLPSGVYYYYIEFEGKRLVRKMIITH
jgi:hypothetical protein